MREHGVLSGLTFLRGMAGVMINTGAIHWVTTLTFFFRNDHHTHISMTLHLFGHDWVTSIKLIIISGVHFHKALFVPNQSVYNRVGSHASPPADPQHVDLSWQLTLQKVWEGLARSDGGLSSTRDHERSSVCPSLPMAIKWLRENAQQNRSARFQVLVTGSLHLVGDVLRLIKK